MIRWILLLSIAYLIVKAMRKNFARTTNKSQNQRNRPSSKSPYEILHVSQNADTLTIKKAYREALSQNHPDKVAHLSKEIQDTARQKMDEIQWAYDQLR